MIFQAILFALPSSYYSSALENRDLYTWISNPDKSIITIRNPVGKRFELEVEVSSPALKNVSSELEELTRF